MKRRLLAIGLLLACFSSFLHAKGDRKNFQIYDFSKGLDTYHNASTLPDGFVQDSLNVFFDAQAPGQKRPGFSYSWGTKAYSYTGLWTYTDQTNTTWQIARSSDQITAANLAGSVVVVATVSANNLVGETNAFGNAYFVDQSQGLYFWNGTSTTYVTSSPKGSIITQFHNRLWITGAAVPSGNQLYGSAYYDGSTWTTGSLATDPVQYSIGLQDNFDNVTAEYVYLDTLYLFKHYSISALYGFDQPSFQISNLTQECGCVDGGSIQTFNGSLKFLSLRGVEDFNGYTCKRISDPVKDKVDPSIQSLSFSAQSWIQESQADWQAGTITPSRSLSTTIASNAVTVSSTLVHVDSSTWNVPNPSFEACPSSILSNWTPSGSGIFCTSAAYLGLNSCGTARAPRTGLNYLEINADPVGGWSITLYDYLSGASIYGVSIAGLEADQCTYLSGTLFKNEFGGNLGYVQITNGSGSTLTSDPFIIGNDIVYYYESFSVSTQHVVALEDVLNGATSFISSATLTTGPGVEKVQGFWASGSPSVIVQQSTSSFGAWSTISTSTGTNANNSTNYIRYVATFTRTSGAGAGNDSAATDLKSLNLIQTSTGVFLSQSHNMTPISSFGNFLPTADISGGGSIAYSVCTSANANMTPKACSVQTANTQISVATNTYVQFIATFSVTDSTQTPKLSLATIQWFSTTRPPPLVSTVWDNRYWLSLTTSTADSANDAVLVLNSRGAWADLNIHAGGFTQYKNNLYHADSNATGNVYLDNQGYADNGSPILSYIKTKDESLGGLAADDYLYVVYPSASNTGSCTMSVQYDMDHSGNAMSLGSPLLSEFSSRKAVRLPFPIDTTHQDFGQSINFTVGTNDSACDWQFYGLEGLYRTRPIQ
jgi:hypothetical protein